MSSLSSLLSVPLYSKGKNKQSYISIPPTPKKRYAHDNNYVPCRASNEENVQNSQARRDSPTKFDRRDMLFRLGGLYPVMTLAGCGDKFALADGLLPDVLNCQPIKTPAGDDGCCPPEFKEIIDFVPPVNPKLRVRPAAHLMTPTQVADLERGIEIMRQLDEDDPRSLCQQAKVHCAYCDDAYKQVKNSHSHSVTDFQVHSNALFFPFHRAYLYFFERILGSLIGKPDFAIPFWNWDAPDGMYMPLPYNNPYSSLYDELRDPRHDPQKLLYLNYDGSTEEHGFDVVDCNLHWMKQQMSVKAARKFLGRVIRVSEYPVHDDMGSIEQSPHNNVHNWVGDPNRHDRVDMGDFSTAGRDPLFYAHHANVDRMWNIWHEMGNQDHPDTDWLESAFVFYDENKNAVRIKVSDCLDSKKLGYDYEKVPLPWMHLKKTPLPNNNWLRSNRDRFQLPPVINFPQILDSDITTMVDKPEFPIAGGGDEMVAEDVVLVLEDVEYDPTTRVHFNVLINVVDNQPDVCPAHHEFVGIFNNIPHGVEHQAKTSLHFVITDAIQELGLEGDEKLAVKIEPKLGGENVSIGGIKIQFEPVE